MRNKVVYLLVFIILISSFQGLITSAKKVNEEVQSGDFTHTVFVEVATGQCCKPCHYWNQIIYDIYDTGEYDFQYVEMVVFDYDGDALIDEAGDWYTFYDAGSIPKSIMDGDYRRIANNSEVFIQYLNECGNRAVADISASMTVFWLGDATIQVDISIENNNASVYNGHIRTSITEIVSRYNTYYGEPYHFGFLGFAYDMDISIPSQGIFEDSVTWNGSEHEDNHGNNFGDIVPENIKVTMGILNDADGFVDETLTSYIDTNDPPNKPYGESPTNESTGIDINADLGWSCSDPNGDDLTYDIYYGDTIPPPLMLTGNTTGSYDPGTMEYSTTYYWQIIAEDIHGATTKGPIWWFTTEQEFNNPPTLTVYKDPETVNEGETATNNGTVNDIDGDIVILSASIGTIINHNDGNWSWSYITTDGPDDNQMVTITADDDNGGITTADFQLIVNNIAPIINFVSNDGPIIEGAEVKIIVDASDPAGDNDPLTYSFDCDNDGIYEVGPQNANYTICSFSNSGDYIVNVKVTDDDGDIALGSTVVTVLGPQEAIGEIITEIENLVADGILNKGQGNSLISKLNNAIKKLDQGNIKAATNILYACINQINAFIKAKILTSDLGQSLIDAIEYIIDIINKTHIPQIQPPILQFLKFNPNLFPLIQKVLLIFGL